jgi:hypothetical protein
MSWLGNGEYFLLGNGLVRGRKWNEPFPSNVHILASVAVGDISPCGARGRWVCGDSTLADLRSGDGWDTINPLSIICFPASVGDNSGIYDADPKGSPDGTKICFVSNYPLKDGPRTHIVRAAKDSLEVESTDGFPDQGHLVVSREVIAYQRKSETGFEGLQRRMFDTAGVNLREGRIVTSFERRCMTDGQFNSLPRPIAPMTKSIGDVNSPLMRQRMTDVYIVVVRKPDRPWLRKSAQGKGKPACELIPGENHRETRGYVILRDGLAIDREPVKPGATVSLDKAGRYEAVAVEWSGLRSETSNAITLRRNEVPAELSVGDKMPKDFACVSVRWNSDRTLGETVHGYDGVIRREWYEDGIISKRHDLNEKGQATRRIVFNDGAMAVREYFDRNDQCVSRELFGDAGYITEQIRYGADGAEKDHWWFDQGWPIKHRRGNREYTKHADRWGYFKNGQFVDSPRERE